MRTAILYNFLLEANLMASIAILLMMALRKTLRKPLGNSALSFGWLLVAIRLLLPITLPNPYIYQIRTPYAPDVAIRPIAGQIKVRLTDFLAGIALGKGPVQETVADIRNGMHNASVPITLSRIYLIGLVLVLAWFVFINFRFRQKMKVGRIEPISGKLLEDYKALCAQMKVRQLPVCFTDPLPSACLVGVLKPCIALPLTVSPNNAIHVLRHELCHYQNRDHYWGILRLVCCALHWFNPLVWMAAFMSQTDGELRCDDRVTASMNPKEKEAYASVLVLSAARRNAPGLAVLATGMTHTHRKLKTRMKTVLNGHKPLRWLSITFALLAAMSLVGAFATTETPDKPRLTRISDIPAEPRIANREEAIIFGKKLMVGEELNLATKDLMKLEEVELTADTDAYLVTARQKDDDVILVSTLFDKAGRVYNLHNHMSNWKDAYAYASVTLALSEQEEQDLAQDLQNFLCQMNPGEALRANYWTSSATRFGEDIYVDFSFYNVKPEPENSRAPSVRVSVQITPEVRIVYLNFNMNKDDSNG